MIRSADRQVFCQVWHGGSNAKDGWVEGRFLLVSCHFSKEVSGKPAVFPTGYLQVICWNLLVSICFLFFFRFAVWGGILWIASRDYVLLPCLWIVALIFLMMSCHLPSFPGWLAIARAFTEPELMELQSLKDERLLLPWNTRRWFQTFFVFIPTWGNDPIWQIFFRWVETTNQNKSLHFPSLETSMRQTHFAGLCPSGWR